MPSFAICPSCSRKKTDPMDNKSTPFSRILSILTMPNSNFTMGGWTRYQVLRNSVCVGLVAPMTHIRFMSSAKLTWKIGSRTKNAS
eukprot:scaffold136480_cov31-Attheya_sp.AAC.1